MIAKAVLVVDFASANSTQTLRVVNWFLFHLQQNIVVCIATVIVKKASLWICACNFLHHQIIHACMKIGSSEHIMMRTPRFYLPQSYNITARHSSSAIFPKCIFFTFSVTKSPFFPSLLNICLGNTDSQDPHGLFPNSE